MGPPRRSSRQTSKEADEPSCSQENKFNPPEKEASQWMFLVNDSGVEQSAFEENKPTICPLRHPKSDKKALFLFTHGDRNIYEITQFKEGYRSWFIGTTVQHDGSLYLTTPVDPVFLVLPYLVAEESKSGKFMTLDQILCDNEYPECNRLNSVAGMSELHQVAEVRGDDDFQAYRYDRDRTLSWLKLKTERVAEILEKKHICVSGSQSGAFIKSSRGEAPKDDYLRYAFGMVSDYLPVSLSNSLREYLEIPAVVEKRPSDAENPPSKRVKLENLTPLEDYSSKQNGSQDKMNKTKLTTAQKKLSQTDKTGMKSISSFFSPKTKS